MYLLVWIRLPGELRVIADRKGEQYRLIALEISTPSVPDCSSLVPQTV